MKTLDAIEQALRGFRGHLRHHLLATSSLIIAFLCLSFALLAVENLADLEAHWAGDRRLSVYLDDAADLSAVTQLRLVLGSLEEVSDITYLSPRDARAAFVADARQGALASLMDELPESAFPGSLELTLLAATSPRRIEDLSVRIRGLHAVADVDTYAASFSQLQHMLGVGRTLTAALTALVALCVMAVIANSIRLTLTQRRQEIEIMRLCGATEMFVRTPVVIEGAIQGVLAALLALGTLSLAFFLGYGQLEPLTSAAFGIAPSFLGPLPVAVMLALGLLGGTVGSAWSLYQLDRRGEA